MHLWSMQTMLPWSSNLLLMTLTAAKKPSLKNESACESNLPIERDVLVVAVAVDHNVRPTAMKHLSKK